MLESSGWFLKWNWTCEGWLQVWRLCAAGSLGQVLEKGGTSFSAPMTWQLDAESTLISGEPRNSLRFLCFAIHKKILNLLLLHSFFFLSLFLYSLTFIVHCISCTMYLYIFPYNRSNVSFKFCLFQTYYFGYFLFALSFHQNKFPFHFIVSKVIPFASKLSHPPFPPSFHSALEYSIFLQNMNSFIFFHFYVLLLHYSSERALCLAKLCLHFKVRIMEMMWKMKLKKTKQEPPT